MRVIADLHLHGRFSRATSKDLTLTSLERYAKIKGLNLLGTGDFTHPGWFKEIKEATKEEGGILQTRSGFSFVLQTEISSIYTQNNKGRRVHNIILAPSLDVAEQINSALSKRGRLDYDGRPIFNLPCPELVEMMRSISTEIEIIPAHAWTPWFSVFGSNSGFNSMEECFQDQTKHIHALETGLSSDPQMNWRLSSLDRYTLISNSDSHSFWPWRIGRECNVLELGELNYKELIRAIRTKMGFRETIEFWPQEGKYHLDGHRACNVVLEPREAIKLNNICPVCKKPLTVGVLHRIEELADRPEGFKPEGAVPFRNIIPLSELIAGINKTTPASKKAWEEYNLLINAFGNELNVLLDVEEEELKKVATDKAAGAIIRNRGQGIMFEPGYDGVYGKPIFENIAPGSANLRPRRESSDKEIKKEKGPQPQRGLGEFF